MNYKGVKYHKIGDSTIIFYEIDNHINNDAHLSERLLMLLDIIRTENAKHLIINRIGSEINEEKSVPDAIDDILFKNLKANGIEKIFIIETEKEKEFSPFQGLEDNVYIVNTMTDVYNVSMN